jgi:hypothetical protein
VRFEVLTVVNMGCYAMLSDRKLPTFQKNMPAFSGYTRPEDGGSRVLEDVDKFLQSYMA